MSKKGLFRIRIEYENFPLCDARIKEKDLDDTIREIKKKVK